MPRALRVALATAMLALSVASGAALADSTSQARLAAQLDAAKQAAERDLGQRLRRILERDGIRDPGHRPQDDFRPGGAGAEGTGAGDAHDHAHDRGDEHSHPHADAGSRARDRGRGAAVRSRASGPTAGRTTLEQTITGDDPADGFQFLREAGGERRVIREDLARARPGRQGRRESLLYAAQTTDWQIADEESPARVEFLDITANRPFPTALSAAHRPHEALGPFAIEMGIRQLNRFADESPHRQGDGARAPMDMVLLTGDQADNQQLNETRWVVELLQGERIDPNSGVDPSACPPLLRPQGQTADPRRYAGVQDYGDYLGGPLALQFYDPNQPAGIYGDWPTYPGLMDRAQLPFRAQGLRVPSYVTPGNHDGLAQGNQATIAPFETVAVGCIKPLVPVAPLTDADDLADVLPEVLNPNRLGQLVTENPGQVMLVPPDPDRRYVDKEQYRDAFDTGHQDDAHGFAYVDPEELAASNGAASYYQWRPKPGLRMISIDTLCEGGVAGPGASGNLDDPQYRWLERELGRAQRRGELIIVFGHHPIRSLECPLPDELAPPCTFDHPEFGRDINPGCDRDPRNSSPIHLGDSLEALLSSYPNVIAYVAGHTHEHHVQSFAGADVAEPELRGEGASSFWGIESASLVDWPPQNRLIELMDNCDGTLSFVTTVLNTAAPIVAPASGADASEMRTADLASVSRTIAYNDPQVGAGYGDGRRRDRNAELLIEDPRSRPSECTRERRRASTPQRPERPADSREERGSPRPAEGGGPVGPSASAPARGALAFTGLALGVLLALGLAFVALGRLARRLERPGPG